MTYVRHINQQLLDHINQRHQALILTGPRQVGKTKLLTTLFPRATYLNCDDQPTQNILNSHSIATYKLQLPHSGILILDEVQNLNDPGRVGKIITDTFPKIKLLITGSAGLTIKNKHTESMAGRAINYKLYPLTLSEYLTQNQIQNEKLQFNIFNTLVTPKIKSPIKKFYDPSTLLDRILVYGLYPALIGDPNPREYLLNLIDRIIFKDLLDLKLIEDKSKATKLLTVLAHQIGQVISMAELGNITNLDQRTILRYINLFQDSYLIYLLYPYSKRERDVLSKRPKIYFYDTGIRNALIGNFQSLATRADMGSIFENFIIMEALKAVSYQQLDAKLYYWRTKQGAEIDLVIDYRQQLFGIECKWNRGRITTAFKNRYPEAIVKMINQDII